MAQILNIIDTLQFVSKYTDLHLERVRDDARYKYKFKPIIYALICSATAKVYIGSTWDSVRRFRQHLVTGHTSNLEMQEHIKEHGLESFSLIVLDIVKFPSSTTKDERRVLLRKKEQEYKDKFPLEIQYPGNRAFASEPK